MQKKIENRTKIEKTKIIEIENRNFMKKFEIRKSKIGRKKRRNSKIESRKSKFRRSSDSNKSSAKLQFPYMAQNWTIYMSFERARRAESNDTKIIQRKKFWAELQTPKVQKTIGGTKLFFGVKNSKMQIIPHSKELFELSRMTPKSTKSDLI